VRSQAGIKRLVIPGSVVDYLRATTIISSFPGSGGVDHLLSLAVPSAALTSDKTERQGIRYGNFWWRTSRSETRDHVDQAL
jgi:hypothetical protein